MFSEAKIDDRGVVVFYTKTGEKFYVANHGGEMRRPTEIALRGEECTFTYSNGDTLVFHWLKSKDKIRLVSADRTYKLSPHDFFAQPFLSNCAHVANVNRFMYYVDEGGRTHEFATDAEIVRVGDVYMMYRDSVFAPIEPKPCGARFYYTITGISINIVNFMIVKAKWQDFTLAGPYMMNVKKIAYKPNTAYPISIETNAGCYNYAINSKYQLETADGECINIYDNPSAAHYMGDLLYTIGGNVYTRVSTDQANLTDFDKANYFERGVFKFGLSYICQMVSIPSGVAAFTVVRAK